MVRQMKKEKRPRLWGRSVDLSRKVARRTIGLAAAPERPQGGWGIFWRQSRGVQGLRTAIGLAVAGALFWLGLNSGAALPDMAINEEVRVKMGIFLLFITISLGLVVSLAAAMWLAVSINKSRQIEAWPQTDIRLPLKQLKLPFNRNGECRPRVEFEYVVNGELYRSGRLPPLARLVREEEAETVEREFYQIRWATYNPRRIREAYLLIPAHYLNSLRHETICLGFAVLMTVLLGSALWYVADAVIPVVLRSL